MSVTECQCVWALYRCIIEKHLTKCTSTPSCAVNIIYRIFNLHSSSSFLPHAWYSSPNRSDLTENFNIKTTVAISTTGPALPARMRTNVLAISFPLSFKLKQLVVFHHKGAFLSNFVLILITLNLSLWVLYYTVKLWNAHFWTTVACSFTCYQQRSYLLKSSLWMCHLKMVKMYRKLERKSPFTSAATWWSSTLEIRERWSIKLWFDCHGRWHEVNSSMDAWNNCAVVEKGSALRNCELNSIEYVYFFQYKSTLSNHFSYMC